MNVSQLIIFNGYYSLEEHQVVTKDDYILSVQRIKCGFRKLSCQPGRPVLLQHGLLDTAKTWVNNPGTKSLAFFLAELGYDVWMSNTRGNTYSKNHLYMSPKTKQFWKFSLYEFAHFDLPAVLDHVLQVTGQPNLAYVGHSQGTSIAMAYFSRHPEMSHKVNSLTLLAPVAYLSHVQTTIRLIAKTSYVMTGLLSLFTTGEFLPTLDRTETSVKLACSLPLIKTVCDTFFYTLAGESRDHLDPNRLDVYLTSGGTSVQNMDRFAQNIRSGKFQDYNHGSAQKNIQNYGHPEAKEYTVDNIRIPTAFFSGGLDTLADPRDVHRLASKYDSKALKVNVQIGNFTHLDFVWGIKSHILLYPQVEEFIRKHSA